jgi:hypothetical protein
VLEHGDRRQLGPLQIIDHDGNRAILGHGLEHRCDGIEQIPADFARAPHILAQVGTVPSNLG